MIAGGKNLHRSTYTIKWCVQFSQRTNVDDYDITRMYFNRRPSRNNIIIAQKVDDLKCDFLCKRLNENFHCWECGTELHWLDIEGDFNEKITALQDKYCGC